MKKYIIILAIFLTGINYASASWLDNFFAYFKGQPITTLGAGVFLPVQGGTGISSAGAGDVNKCLIVSDDSPFTYTIGACSAGGGEANTGSSLGTGRNIFDSKSGVDLRFNTLSAGTNITLSTTSNNNTIVINSTGGGTIDGTGSANTLTYWTDSDTLSATSSPTVGYITATSTTATSTFAGAVTIDSSDVYVNGMGLYQPTGENMKYPNETIITTFQAGHGWTKTYAGGTLTDDTADFIIGTQSVKSNTNAVSTNIRKTSISPALNLSDKIIRFVYKVDNADALTSATIYISSDNSFTNYLSCNFWNITARSDANSVWFPLTLNIGDTISGCAKTGNPDLSAIVAMQFTLNSNADINVNINKVSYFDKPNEGVVSLTFDDGWATQYTNAKAYMATSSLPGVAYVNPSSIGTGSYMSLTQLKELQDIHGWDIACHTTNHTILTSVSTSTAEAELVSCKNWLLKNGFQKGAEHFAYPGGAYNEHTVLPLVKKYFKSARTIEEYTETLPAYDPYRLRIYNITESDATTTVQTAIQKAKDNKEWLILTFHSVIDTVTAPSTQIQTLKFQAIIDTVVSSGVKVKTISEVLNQTNPNLLELQNGAIRIGTTSPPYSRLSVWGAGTGANRLFELTNSASTTLAAFQENGTGYFLGNIGIGTTSPNWKLSVAGNGSFDDFVRASYLTATSTTATSTFNGYINLNTTAGNTANCFAIDGKCATPRWISPYHGGGAVAATSATTTAGTTINMEFESLWNMPIDKMCYQTGSATTSAPNIIVGVYGPITTEETILSAPLLVKSATTTGITTANAMSCISFTAPANLGVGRYYMSFLSPEGASFLRQGSQTQITGWIQTFTGTGNDLPAIAPTPTDTGSNGMGMKLRGAKPN